MGRGGVGNAKSESSLDPSGTLDKKARLDITRSCHVVAPPDLFDHYLVLYLDAKPIGIRACVLCLSKTCVKSVKP